MFLLFGPQPSGQALLLSLFLVKAERRKTGMDGGNLAERELRNSFKT